MTKEYKPIDIKSDFNDIIIFLDEDDTKKDIHVKILEIGTSFVTFENTSNNRITIPAIRVLKIKRRNDEKSD